ncbi:MAG: PhzF family phenazine biosynthesis protein [Povalibacter sp.]
MTTLAYRILNVFTRNGERLSGNPLCVFEDGSALDSNTMQALARQFNLSETTFILPSTRATARVRIFTPDYEMPFAGHPTLGTAFACRALGKGDDELTLEMTAGIIPVKAQGDRWTLRANTPTWREAPAEAIARMLSLNLDEIAGTPLWVKAGKEQLIVPLRDEAAVRRVRPKVDLMSQVKSEDGHCMAYVFAHVSESQLLSRFFFPSGTAILEDPATGSATANLGGWLIASGKSLPLSYQISQGEYTGRPSSLYLAVTAERQIFVSGDVIELGSGTVTI